MAVEFCAVCQKPVLPTEPCYSERGYGRWQMVHTACGDPLGSKAREKRIAELEAFVHELATTTKNLATNADRTLMLDAIRANATALLKPKA